MPGAFVAPSDVTAFAARASLCSRTRLSNSASVTAPGLCRRHAPAERANRDKPSSPRSSRPAQPLNAGALSLSAGAEWSGTPRAMPSTYRRLARPRRPARRLLDIRGSMPVAGAAVQAFRLRPVAAPTAEVGTGAKNGLELRRVLPRMGQQRSAECARVAEFSPTPCVHAHGLVLLSLPSAAAPTCARGLDTGHPARKNDASYLDNSCASIAAAISLPGLALANASRAARSSDSLLRSLSASLCSPSEFRARSRCATRRRAVRATPLAAQSPPPAVGTTRPPCDCASFVLDPGHASCCPRARSRSARGVRGPAP